MRLQTVDHMLIRLQEHAEPRRVAFPDEDVAAVAARHDEVVAPEIRLLDHCPKETRVTHERRAEYENIAWADINSPSVHFRGFTFAFDTRVLVESEDKKNSFQATRKECRSHIQYRNRLRHGCFFFFFVYFVRPSRTRMDLCLTREI